MVAIWSWCKRLVLNSHMGTLSTNGLNIHMRYTCIYPSKHVYIRPMCTCINMPHIYMYIYTPHVYMYKYAPYTCTYIRHMCTCINMPHIYMYVYTPHVYMYIYAPCINEYIRPMFTYAPCIRHVYTRPCIHVYIRPMYECIHMPHVCIYIYINAHSKNVYKLNKYLRIYKRPM